MHGLRYSLLLTVLAACSSRNAETTHSFRIYEENGVTIAETTGGPKYEGELFEYVPVLVLEPGETEETMLFNPWHFTADAEGWFYVYDEGNGDIMVFDPNGKFHNRFGRKGPGPGEFQRLEFLFTEGDTLYVFDSSLRRTTRFRRSGELVDVVSVPVLMRTGVTGLIPLPGGDQLILSLGEDYSEDGRDNWHDIVRLRADEDTLWSWQSEPIRTCYQVTFTLGGETFTNMAPYPHAPFLQSFFVPALGVVAGAGYAPQLDIIDVDGRLRRRIRIDMGDLTVTEEDRQEVYDWHDRTAEEIPDVREQYEMARKVLRFGEKKAPWIDLKFDDRGYLYLMPESFWGTLDQDEDFRYLVISPDGEYLGITRRPGRWGGEVIGGRLLVNRSDDETGEFILTVYEIRPIVEGLYYP